MPPALLAAVPAALSTTAIAVGPISISVGTIVATVAATSTSRFAQILTPRRKRP